MASAISGMVALGHLHPSSLPKSTSNTRALCGGAMEQSSDLSPKVLGERTEKFLCAAHPRHTAKCVATNTGCNLAAVEKWLEGSSAPGGVALLRLIAAYGPEFIMAVWPNKVPEWLSNSALDERIRLAEAARAALETELKLLHAAR